MLVMVVGVAGGGVEAGVGAAGGGVGRRAAPVRGRGASAAAAVLGAAAVGLVPGDGAGAGAVGGEGEEAVAEAGRADAHRVRVRVELAPHRSLANSSVAGSAITNSPLVTTAVHPPRKPTAVGTRGITAEMDSGRAEALSWMERALQRQLGCSSVCFSGRGEDKRSVEAVRWWNGGRVVGQLGRGVMADRKSVV